MAYISNVPISRPNSLPTIKPDVNMNGLSWSNKYGLFFHVSETIFDPVMPPPTVKGM